jgi:hypothetical protein
MNRGLLSVLMVFAACESEPDTVDLRIHFDGAGTGTVYVHALGLAGPPQMCESDCTLHFSRDQELQVGALVTSEATRFSCVNCGSDANDAGIYNIGPFDDADLDLTVRFSTASDDPLAFAFAGAYLPDGDLAIVAGGGAQPFAAAVIAKVSVDGEVRWMTEPSTELLRQGLATTADGGVYVFDKYASGGDVVTRLDVDGQIVFQSPGVLGAVTSSGDVLVTEDQNMARRSGTDGAEVWTVALPMPGQTQSMTVSSAGVLYVASKTVDDGSQGRIDRFDASSGAPIGDPWTIAADVATHISMTTDQTGALIVRTNRLMRLDPSTGTALYDIEQAPPDNTNGVNGRTYLGTGVDVTDANQVLHWATLTTTDVHKGNPYADGTVVAAVSSDGNETFQLVLPPSSYDPNDALEATNVVGSASCHARTCALFGQNMPVTFIEVP